jgi:DnaJ-class molecular chaperone
MVNTTLDVIIPAGADTHYSIRLPGMGNEVPFKTPGDAKIVVNALPDGLYQRNGSELTLHVDLSLKEALLGWNRTLTHPNGTKFGVIYDRMSSPGRSVCNPLSVD